MAGALKSCLERSMMSILAEWAILTKYPGDAKDYRILASNGGGLDAQEYHALIRKWLTGEVPFEGTIYNPAAPWYQFGMESNPLRQVVLRQEWTGYVDFRNRPVLITTCLLLPFKDLAEVGCGFGSIARLFEQEEVKTYLLERIAEITQGEERRDFERLKIHLPEREEALSWMKQVVEEIGYTVCVQAANMLLHGSLGLVQPSGEIIPWEERVKWADAVLALLPYGLRVDCPTSLWASSSADHSMRLYWGRSARQGHGRLMVPISSNSAGTSDTQEPYIEDLVMLQTRIPLDQILAHLATQNSPRSFESPLLRNVLDGLGRSIGISYPSAQLVSREFPKSAQPVTSEPVNPH